MRLNITVDTKKFKIMTDKELNKQVEFAARQANSDTAFDARKAVQEHLESKLNLTRKFIPQSVVVDKATKTNNTAYVGFLSRFWMAELLEEGGRRLPKSSRNVAVPSSNIKRGRSGAVTKANRPRQLLSRPDVFVKDFGKGKGVWKRLRNGKLQLLYNLEPSTDYDPRQIQFYKVAKSAAEKNWYKHFEKRLDYALRTAKLK